MGYTDIVSISILPRNMLGYQHPTSYDDRQPAFLPDHETFPMIIKLQSEDITKETIKHSLKGLFVGGELVFIYTQGDDMAYVAKWFDATMEDIYQWNPSLPKDGNIMNNRAIIIKDKKPTSRKSDIQQKAVVSSTAYAGTQDTALVFPFLKNEDAVKNDNRYMQGAMVLSGILLADDATGVGVIDDLLIPFILAGAYILVLYNKNPVFKGPWIYTHRPPSEDPIHQQHPKDPNNNPKGWGGKAIVIFTGLYEVYDNTSTIFNNFPQDTLKRDSSIRAQIYENRKFR